MKQYILIDGENFVHGLVHILRSQKLISSREDLARINLKTLFADIPDLQSPIIQYYSTRVEVPDKSSELYETVEKMRQWNAKWAPHLANQGVKFIKAGILKARNSKRCSHCKKRTEILLEKGVDVRLGVDIAAQNEKGTAMYLFSSDSDLLPAIAVARNHGVKIVYMAFQGSENHALSRASNQSIIISKATVKTAYNEAQKMKIDIKRITTDDDLKAVAASVVGKEWDEANNQDDYSESALGELIPNQDYVLLIAYDDRKPVGLALAMKLLKPDGDHWFYVDELDTHPDYRRRSIGRQLMEELFSIAKKWGLNEVWLGTEPDNDAANHLYRSLKPSEIEPFIGYTYKPKIN